VVVVVVVVVTRIKRATVLRYALDWTQEKTRHAPN
jgi:hypothetical protein